MYVYVGFKILCVQLELYVYAILYVFLILYV